MTSRKTRCRPGESEIASVATRDGPEIGHSSSSAQLCSRPPTLPEEIGDERRASLLGGRWCTEVPIGNMAGGIGQGIAVRMLIYHALFEHMYECKFTINFTRAAEIESENGVSHPSSERCMYECYCSMQHAPRFSETLQPTSCVRGGRKAIVSVASDRTLICCAKYFISMLLTCVRMIRLVLALEYRSGRLLRGRRRGSSWAPLGRRRATCT